MPGLLTALAGILTAAAGLLVVLNQVGVLGHHDAPRTEVSERAPGNAPASSTAPATSSSPAPAPGAVAGGKAGYRVSLPSESSVILRNHRAVCTYQLLGTEVRRRTAEQLTLTISVRLTNAGPLDTSFGTDSFRLLVDGVPREPTNWVNTAVDARSAKDTQIEFDLPTSAKTLELQITNEETGSIPLALQRLS